MLRRRSQEVLIGTACWWLAGVLGVSRTTVYALADTQQVEALRISPEGDTQNQPAGEGFALFCNKGHGSGAYTNFQWIGPQGQEIGHNTSAPINVFESKNGLVLSFDNPSPENSGRYICNALYGGTSHLEVSVKISFFHDITFDDCPVKQDLIVGREGTIRCNVHGNPVPSLHWAHIPTAGTLSSDKFILHGTGLQIRHVENSDAGRYQVTASVEATGKIKKKFITVNVLTPPSIIEVKPVVQIVEGKLGTLLCSVNGVPPPLCYWTDFRGQNLSDVGAFRVTPQTCMLEMLVSSREHEGSYTCHAVNAAGRANRSAKVDVFIPPKILEFQNLTVNENNDTLFECKAEGRPAPDISVRKEGAELPLGSGDPNGLVDVEHMVSSNQYISTLRVRLRRVQRHRAGLYYCSVENAVARVERIGRIDVNYAPVLTAKTNPVYTWASRPATLTCHVQAIPNATVEWRDSNGKALVDSSLYEIENDMGVSTLIVRSGGADRFDRDYVCHADNTLGSGELPFRVLEARRPDAPGQPEILRVTATTVTFVFNKLVTDGGMPILEYLIRFWREADQRAEDAETKTFAEIISKPLVIGKLTPRTQYLFTFSARSEVGEGPRSAVMPVSTAGEAVPDRPSFINPPHTDAHPSRVHIEWTMPLDNGKKIDCFRLSYQPVEELAAAGSYRAAGRKRVVEVTSWSSMVSTDLLDLRPESFYRVTIEAHNEIGYGDSAELVFRTGATQGLIGAHPDGEQDATLLSKRLAGGLVSIPVIIALAVLVLFLILIVCDVLCYFRFRRGLLYILRHLVCSKPKHVYSKTSQTANAATGNNP